MAYVHTCEFRVRHYECDQDGVLRPATVLGYLQEAAFEASAAVGYSAQRYDEIGYQWFAYETQLDLFQPFYYDDVVQVKTWVMDFRRVRSLRHYEVYKAGVRVGYATTDWVFINTKTLYPSAILPEIVAAYSVGDAVLTPVPREALGAFPPPPTHAQRYQRRVESRDIDPAHHVNNAVYLLFAAEAERMATGETPSPLQHLQIEYKAAAKLDDVLEITTWAEAGLRYTLIERNADQKLLARILSKTH